MNSQACGETSLVFMSETASSQRPRGFAPKRSTPKPPQTKAVPVRQTPDAPSGERSRHTHSRPEDSRTGKLVSSVDPPGSSPDSRLVITVLQLHSWPLPGWSETLRGGHSSYSLPRSFESEDRNGRTTGANVEHKEARPGSGLSLGVSRQPSSVARGTGFVLATKTWDVPGQREEPRSLLRETSRGAEAEQCTTNSPAGASVQSAKAQEEEYFHTALWSRASVNNLGVSRRGAQMPLGHDMISQYPKGRRRERRSR